jgi:acetyl-CoA synthase
VEFGGNGSRAFEFLETVELDKVIDGKIEIVGPDFSKVLLSGHMDLGLVVQVAGSPMEQEFEPLLERQIHSFLNRACGIEHSGRRDAVRIRVSNAAATSGLGLESLGKILATRFHEDFGGIVDKVQVKVVTDPASHVEWLQKARASFDLRDRRLADLTDAAVEEFYSCTLCQSVMPDHVCVISPERPGPCGAYNWLDCRSMFDIDPSGPNQPIKLGRPIDLEKGSWDGINGWVAGNSRRVVNLISMYSLMRNPLTASGCSDCVVMLIPEANGVMIVSREDSSMTPAGLTFAALSEIAGTGMQTPGVMGVGKSYLISPKFISADGGFKRVVWMSSMLKQSMSTELKAVCKREGDPDFMDKIADEGTATSVHELLAWLELHDHPALAMEPIF